MWSVVRPWFEAYLQRVNPPTSANDEREAGPARTRRPHSVKCAGTGTYRDTASPFNTPMPSYKDAEGELTMERL